MAVKEGDSSQMEFGQQVESTSTLFPLSFTSQYAHKRVEMERRGNKSGHQNTPRRTAIPLGLTFAMSACISRTKTVTVATRDVVADVRVRVSLGGRAEIQKLVGVADFPHESEEHPLETCRFLVVHI